MFRHRRAASFTQLTMAALLAICFGPIRAQQATAESNSDPAQLWSDFNHYVRVARPDLASASAAVLLDSVNNAQLLDIVETGDYPDYEKTFERAERVETMAETLQQLRDRIQTARVAKSRDSDRIQADIEALAGTIRQRHNATQRLRAAGQFAAPQLLDVLLDQKKPHLHPHVETAIVAIGKPLVYPLSVTLSQLEPVQMSQVARALAEIGYPRSMPYLKEILEAPDTDEHALLIVQTAYDRLASSVAVPTDVSAAELFHTLGENYYKAGTTGALLPGFDAATNRGMVWIFSPTAGLVKIPVPASIFADVLAMRAAERALALDEQLDPALTLWLTANLRRENRLGEGDMDPSYDVDREPTYYARIAGPLRMHECLDRAMNDEDADLAIDAINALWATAGTDALINRQGAVQPLIRALTYGDRRVRFPAAFVMTQTRPTSEFPGSPHVVTVLAEAVRQTELTHALAIAADQESLNRLMAAVKTLDYQVTGGLSLESVIDAVNTGPGFDLIIANLDAAGIEALTEKTAQNYKLSTAPILALVSIGDQSKIEMKYKGNRRLRTALATTDPQALREAVRQTASTSSGQPITAEEAVAYASKALQLLRDVGRSGSTVYDLSESEPTVIAAIDDPRHKIVVGAAQVLELLDSQAAQLALASAAVDDARPEDVRVALLNSLAESAKQFGNKLGQIELDDLIALVRSSDGDMALAAARAQGALTLPTSSVVDMIVE